MARLPIPGIVPGLKYGLFMAPFALGHYRIGTDSCAITGKPLGASSFIGKNIGAAVQLTQYANVSLSSVHNRIGADIFTAQQINSGKLS
ncbi:hypothetical protein DHC50_00715 [Arenibacter sp. A80]|nr:hypothetical protein [Arenibacter sp. A80]RFT57724.1 hypothetical protein D0S24_00715 [Arenibacter sp. P308M17]